MGFSVAVSGGITATIVVVIMGIIVVMGNQIHTENVVSTKAFESSNALDKTKIEIYGINASSGSNQMNFTLANVGIEKIWQYDEIDLFVTYDADIAGISTKVNEQFTYNGSAFRISPAQTTLTADFRIQRGVTVFGAASDTTTANILDVNQSRAFVKLTNVVFSSGGRDVNTNGGTNLFNDDLGVRASITADDTITFTRLASGENVDHRVAWEVWEYIGKEGGTNEFIVRDVIEVTTTNAVAVDTNISGIVDNEKVVPFITGLTNTITNRNWDEVNAAVWMINDDVRVQRLGTTAGTTITGVAIVEFTGKNWEIQSNIDVPLNGLASATNHVQQIIPVNSWDDAFILSSKNNRNGAPGLDENGWNVWPHPANLDEFHYRMRVNSGAFTTEKIVAHIIENFFMRVEHIDSITGNRAQHVATQPADNEADEPITAVDDLSQSGIIATHDTNGGGTAYPRMNWNYRFDADDNVEWYRGRDGQAGDFAMQVIQFPQSEKCIGGDHTITEIKEWTISCITYDNLDPGILNPGEEIEIQKQLEYPIFPNGFVEISISTPNGKVYDRSMIVP